MNRFLLLFLLIFLTNTIYASELYRERIYNFKDKSIICMDEKLSEKEYKDGITNYSDMDNINNIINNNFLLTEKKIINVYTVCFGEIQNYNKNIFLYPIPDNFKNLEVNLTYVSCGNNIVFDKLSLKNSKVTIWDIKEYNDKYILVYTDTVFIYIDYISQENKKVYREYKLPFLLSGAILSGNKIKSKIESIKIISDNLMKINFSDKIELWNVKIDKEYYDLNKTLYNENILNHRMIWSSFSKNLENYKSYFYFEQDTEPTIEQLKEKFPNDTFFVEEQSGELKSSVNTGDSTKLGVFQKITLWCKKFISKCIGA